MQVAVGRRERAEDRLERRDHLAIAADHQAEAVREAPDAAGRPGIDVADAVLGQLRVAADVVVEVRVAAVDDRVAGLQVLQQLLDLRLRRGAGRDHDPGRPRLRELRDELRDAVGRLDVVAGRALLVGQLVGLLDRAVVGDDRVPVPDQASDHVRAHPPEPDEAELHLRPPSRARA